MPRSAVKSLPTSTEFSERHLGELINVKTRKYCIDLALVNF